MSKWIWIVIVIVVVVLGLWYFGVFGGSTTTGSQGAVVVNSSSTPGDQALSNATLKLDLSKIDALLATVNKNVGAIGSPATRNQVLLAATSVGPVVTAITTLETKLQSLTTNGKTTGKAVPAAQVFADLNMQLTNASSAAGTANKNSSGTSTNAASLSASAGQLKTAQTDLTAARADLESMFKTLGIQ